VCKSRVDQFWVSVLIQINEVGPVGIKGIYDSKLEAVIAGQQE